MAKVTDNQNETAKPSPEASVGGEEVSPKEPSAPDTPAVAEENRATEIVPDMIETDRTEEVPALLGMLSDTHSEEESEKEMVADVPEEAVNETQETAVEEEAEPVAEQTAEPTAEPVAEPEVEETEIYSDPPPVFESLETLLEGADVAEDVKNILKYLYHSLAETNAISEKVDSVTKNTVDLAKMMNALSLQYESQATGMAAHISDVRVEMAANMSDVRAEMAANMSDVKAEMAANTADVKTEIAANTSDVKFRNVLSKSFLAISSAVVLLLAVFQIYTFTVLVKTEKSQNISGPAVLEKISNLNKNMGEYNKNITKVLENTAQQEHAKANPAAAEPKAPEAPAAGVVTPVPVVPVNVKLSKLRNGLSEKKLYRKETGDWFVYNKKNDELISDLEVIESLNQAYKKLGRPVSPKVPLPPHKALCLLKPDGKGGTLAVMTNDFLP